MWFPSDATNANGIMSSGKVHTHTIVVENLKSLMASKDVEPVQSRKKNSGGSESVFALRVIKMRFEFRVKRRRP